MQFILIFTFVTIVHCIQKGDLDHDLKTNDQKFEETTEYFTGNLNKEFQEYLKGIKEQQFENKGLNYKNEQQYATAEDLKHGNEQQHDNRDLNYKSKQEHDNKDLKYNNEHQHDKDLKYRKEQQYDTAEDLKPRNEQPNDNKGLKYKSEQEHLNEDLKYRNEQQYDNEDLKYRNEQQFGSENLKYRTEQQFDSEDLKYRNEHQHDNEDLKYRNEEQYDATEYLIHRNEEQYDNKGLKYRNEQEHDNKDLKYRNEQPYDAAEYLIHRNEEQYDNKGLEYRIEQEHDNEDLKNRNEQQYDSEDFKYRNEQQIDSEDLNFRNDHQYVNGDLKHRNQQQQDSEDDDSNYEDDYDSDESSEEEDEDTAYPDGPALKTLKNIAEFKPNALITMRLHNFSYSETDKQIGSKKETLEKFAEFNDLLSSAFPENFSKDEKSVNLYYIEFLIKDQGLFDGEELYTYTYKSLDKYVVIDEQTNLVTTNKNATLEVQGEEELRLKFNLGEKQDFVEGSDGSKAVFFDPELRINYNNFNYRILALAKPNRVSPEKAKMIMNSFSKLMSTPNDVAKFIEARSNQDNFKTTSQETSISAMHAITFQVFKPYLKEIEKDTVEIDLWKAAAAEYQLASKEDAIHTSIEHTRFTENSEKLHGFEKPVGYFKLSTM